MSTTQIKTLEKHWGAIAPLVSVPRSDLDLERLTAILDELVDEVGENEAHPLAGLLDVIGALVERYEDAAIPELA
jgi:HTH-type transcriptional regulator/antitoxin HigA